MATDPIAPRGAFLIPQPGRDVTSGTHEGSTNLPAVRDVDPSALAAWAETINTALGSVRKAKLTDAAAVSVARDTIEASLRGAVAALNAELATLPRGADARSLLAAIAAGYQALPSCTAATSFDRASLEALISDFKARTTAARRCLSSVTKGERYRLAYELLNKELVKIAPTLSERVGEVSRRAQATSNGTRVWGSCWRAEVAEYRHCTPQILRDLATLAETIAPVNDVPLALPTPARRASAPAPSPRAATTIESAVPANVFTEQLEDFCARCAAADRHWFSADKAAAYRTAFSALAAELSDFPELAAKIERRRTTAMEIIGDRMKVAEFRSGMKRTVTELERLANAAPAGVQLLPAPLPLGASD